MNLTEVAKNELEAGMRVTTPKGKGYIAIVPWVDKASGRAKCRVRIDGTPKLYYLGPGISTKEVYCGPDADKLVKRAIFFCEDVVLEEREVQYILESRKEKPQKEKVTQKKAPQLWWPSSDQWWTKY